MKSLRRLLRAIKNFGSMPWLTQKKGTSHCAPVALYNICKATGVWWIPFWAIKLACLTDIDKVGTKTHRLIRVFRWIFPNMNIIYDPCYDQIKEILTQNLPILVVYCPRISLYHAAAIVPGPTKDYAPSIWNHREHDQEAFDLGNGNFYNTDIKSLEKEIEIMEFTTRLCKQQFLIMYPLDKKRVA